MTKKDEKQSLRRSVSRQLVPIDRMKVREKVTQRELRLHWVQKIARDFDLEKFGVVVTNHVRDVYWILDGQHRMAALKLWLKDWQGQKLECEVYDNLSEAEEAEMFLSLNSNLLVQTFDRYRVGLTAGREAETNIQAVIRKLGLRLDGHRNGTALSCVGTLYRVYQRGGTADLHSVLQILLEGFGPEALEADFIEALSQMKVRYNGSFTDDEARRVFAKLKVNSIRVKAARLQQTLAYSRNTCTAAVLVEALNQGRKQKLPAWWKKA